MTPKNIALALGALALALVLGALGFQYFAQFPPCEMCHWQRWPLIAAAITGIAGPFVLGESNARLLAALAIVLVAISGAIGAYQAGVEWHWWPGPSECTGARVIFNGFGNLNAPGAVRCDVPAWRFLGILSLAGCNAIISLGSALLGAIMLARRS